MSREAAYQAFRDITKYLIENYPGIYKRGGNEIWLITPHRLDTKETRRLNRVLGLHRINKKWSEKTH